MRTVFSAFLSFVRIPAPRHSRPEGRAYAARCRHFSGGFPGANVRARSSRLYRPRDVVGPLIRAGDDSIPIRTGRGGVVGGGLLQHVAQAAHRAVFAGEVAVEE